MKVSEAYGMLARAHAQNVVRAIEKIEHQDWSPTEKAMQIQAHADTAAEEWRRKYWVLVNHFMQNNCNSKLDLAAIERNGSKYCEFGQLRRPRLSAYQMANRGATT